MIPSRVSCHLALVLACAPFNSLLARAAPSRLPSCSPPVPISRSQPSLHACSAASPPIFLDSSRFVVPPSQRNATHPQSKATHPNLTLSFASYLSIHSSSNFHPLVGRGVCEFVWTHFSSTCLFSHVSLFFYCLVSCCFPVHRLTRPDFCEVYYLVSYFSRQSCPRRCSD